LIPKPTEDTITNLLVKELEKCGVKTETFPTISTPSGIRKPDIWCVNAGAYPIEAKFREKDLINAIAKVQNDYIKWCDILGIKGGFALLYPEKLAERLPLNVVTELAYKVKFKAVAMFPPKDTRKSFTVYEGTLSEIAEILAEHILTPPEYVEPSTEYIIKALRESAMYITFALKYLSGKELEDIFGGKEVFKNILQYEEQKYPLENLRLASAYLLINQLLFYHVLSRRMPDKFPEIDADRINKPSDLNEYFKNVLNVNYRTVFSYDVASMIFSGSIDQIRAVINVIKGLAPEKVGGDLLGTIFHDLVPYEVRKSVAAFYTNVLAAELLAWLSIDRYDAKVADLAVGSGGLLVAAYRRKRHLLENKRKFTASDHRKFLEEDLLGIDVMPFAANVAACHLALQSPEYFTDKVNIAIWDSTELEPGKTIPSIASLKYVLKGQAELGMFVKNEDAKVKGIVSLTGELPEEIKLVPYDVVIMNPPFTRQERIPKEYKKKLFERFSDYKECLHGQLGYFGYFIMIADKFLKKGGKLALVLPATILRIESTEGIRRLLVQNYHVEYIITTWQRAAFSEGAQFREILLVAKKLKTMRSQGGSQKLRCGVVKLKKLPESPKESRLFANKVKTLVQKVKIGTTYDDKDINIRIVSQKLLQKNVKNIFRLISTQNSEIENIWDKIVNKGRKKLLPFKQYLKKIGGDIEEGVRARSDTMRAPIGATFVVRFPSRVNKVYDRWVVKNITNKILVAENLITNQMIKIPVESLQYGLRRLSGVNTIDLSNRLDFIVTRKFPDIRSFFMGENVDDILKDLPDWRDYINRRLSKLAIAFRFDMSAKGTTLFAWYSSVPMAGCGVVWNVTGLSDEDSKILALWFNSTINALQIYLDRIETRGAWMQLHKYVMNDLFILNPLSLSNRERKVILSVFDEIKNETFPSFLDQLKDKFSIRTKIDGTILKTLGFNKEETEKIQTRIYPLLYEELSTLKKLMAG